jgi:hypothetical protein
VGQDLLSKQETFEASFIHLGKVQAVMPVFQIAMIFGVYARLGTLYTDKTAA